MSAGAIREEKHVVSMMVMFLTGMSEQLLD